MSAGVTMDGTDQIAAAIGSKLLKMTQAVGTTEIGVVAGGRRGAAKNALIAQVQAARQRNPWYLDKDAMTAIRFVARGLASEDSGVVANALKQVGALMVECVRRNIDNQRGPGGATFRELTARYAAFKRRKYGFISPILKATGDLIDGLKAQITKRL
jgi:hypothetical protein